MHQEYFFFWRRILQVIVARMRDPEDMVLANRLWTFMTLLPRISTNNISQFLWWYMNDATAAEKEFCIQLTYEAIDFCWDEYRS